MKNLTQNITEVDFKLYEHNKYGMLVGGLIMKLSNSQNKYDWSILSSNQSLKHVTSNVV